LPDDYRKIISPRHYSVRISDGICQMRDGALADQREPLHVAEDGT
jgi:hypothetical protein